MTAWNGSSKCNPIFRRPYSPTVHLTYDANGNQLRGLGHTATWNAFNKPSHVNQNGHTSQFYYDANHMRTQQIESRRDGSRITTQYVNANYQRSVTRTADGTT